MAFFVDTNIVIYAAMDGPYRPSCLRILEAAAHGAEARTSTAVLEEAWHVELSGRAGNLTGLAAGTYTVFTPLLAVTDEIVDAALHLRAASVGADDRIHIATCALNGIDTIVSADAGFDGVRGIRRVDPLDARAMARLLDP
jgi:predicted nucleic acid-binding protein